MKCQDTYGEPILYEFPGWKIRVYRPILTEEERARRMKIIEEAAAALLISEEKLKKREKAHKLN